MVKLYTDAENDYMCKDSRTIPLQLREMLLSIDGENRELALGYVTPNNINQYALSLSKTYNVRATAVVKEYNRLYDMKMGISKLDRTPDLQTQQQTVYFYPVWCRWLGWYRYGYSKFGK